MKSKMSAEDRMIWLYRYASLSLTSLVFIFEETTLILLHKCLLTVFLFLSVTLLTWIYRKYRRNDTILKISIALETAGIILLLLPTGGMESPFKWNVITPMLVAGAYLSTLYSWVLLLSYIGLVLTFCYTFFTPGQHFLSDLVLQNVDLLLVLVVTTMAMQVITVMKNELKRAKEQTNETMDHIKSIYHIMETASHNEALNLGQIISDYTVKLTKQSRAFFWLDSQLEEDAPESSQTGWSVEEEEELFEDLGNYRDEFQEEREPFFRHLPEWGDFLMITVPMTTRFVATIGVKLDPDQSLKGRRWLVQQLMFLAELSAVFLERYELERIESQLIVTNEQNRIANEMHDNVSQSLFGIVYATHSLKQMWNLLPKSQVEEQIELIEESANQAVRELKLAIHSLSSKKGGGQSWLGTVKSHLNMLSRLNNVHIDLQMNGDHHTLPYLYQKALFRIISESAGNAIRHGMARRIEVKLLLTPQSIQLRIDDDGVGFEKEKLVAGGEAIGLGGGLGMMNMEYLAHSMGGEFDVISRIGQGTQIKLTIPVQVYE